MGIVKTGQLAAFLWIGVLVVTLCRPASARPEYLGIAKTALGVVPGGAIDKQACNLCHSGSTNKNSLNFYGRAVQEALKGHGTRDLTPEMLHALDAQDSDGDGWPNGAEIKADTLPGDPANKPNGPPPGSLKPMTASRHPGESNPFGPQALLYPSHAQHPVIVHFPIALFIFSLLLDIIGLRTRNRAMNTAAYYNLVASGVTGILSVVTGLLAWRFARDGVPLTQDRWLFFHLVLGVFTTLLICVLWTVRSRLPRDTERPLSRLYLILALLTFAVITLTGHLGGIVSGVVN